MDAAQYTHNEYMKLKEEINFHNYRYHVLDQPVISDSVYDRMLKDLREIELLHPEWVTPDSPTQRVGAEPAATFEKIQHPAPILSLSNAFNEEDLRTWRDRLIRLDDRVEDASYVVEPKIDGLTVVLHYRNGIFIQGATRGNGEIGEDITSNLRTVPSIPLKIPVQSGENEEIPEYLVVRGEAFIAISEFEKLNQRLSEQGEKTYLNPRNTAAGSLRQLDPKIVAQRPISLLAYAVVSVEGTFPDHQWDVLSFLSKVGFPVAEQSKFCVSFEEVLAEAKKWQDLRENLDFEVDGVVIKINDLQLAEDLGFVGKDPRGAIALKFPAREEVTELVDIGVNVGRTGVLTPYAILEPVEIGGVIVRQATLHNFDYIEEKDIRIGDKVFVKRAGDVIPYVIGPVRDVRDGSEKEFYPPKTCPACGQPSEHIEGEVAWFCVNAQCPAQLVRNLEYFVSRSAMDIVGLGIKIVEQLVEEEMVNDVADLYSLTINDLLNLEGFAKKKAENLIQAIQDSKTRSLPRLITALGIRGVGEVMAESLAERYQDLETLSNATYDDLISIEGIGPNIAQAIVDWFERSKNQELLEKLRENGVWPQSKPKEKVEGDLPLYNFVFVVTGTLENFSRSGIKELIQKNGGKVTGSVSKNTDYVLVGADPGSKREKAEQLGIKIIDEALLLEMINK